jgi:hypothetical protein
MFLNLTISKSANFGLNNSVDTHRQAIIFLSGYQKDLLVFSNFQPLFYDMGFLFFIPQVWLPIQGGWKCQPAKSPNYRYHS